MGGQVGGSSPWEEEGGNLQTDAEQLFLFVPIPAKAKKLGLLSIYKFSLEESNIKNINHAHSNFYSPHRNYHCKT
jgi:hypothetical protein